MWLQTHRQEKPGCAKAMSCQDIQRANEVATLARKIGGDKKVLMLIWSNGTNRYLVLQRKSEASPAR